MRKWHWPVVVVFAVAMTLVTATQSSDTRTTMRELHEALTSAFLMSLDERAFQDPANREDILLSLRKLSSNASSLERHGEELSDSYDYLRRSLARDCRDAVSRFEADEFVAARFLLGKLTENCIACHTRQAAAMRFDIGKRFVEDERVKSLPPEDRLRLQIASRQFEQAMETCEGILASRDMITDQIVVTGVFEDYFKLALRVARDPKRAISTLEKISRRPDVPGYMQDVIAVWLATLEDVDLDVGPDRALSQATKLIEEPGRMNRADPERRRLVRFVAATAILHRFLLLEDRDDTERSQAYYLLGLAETHLSQSYWVSETDFFLERSIRLAPHSDWARNSYSLLERYARSSYSGSGGVNIPQDVQANLDQLKALTEQP